MVINSFKPTPILHAEFQRCAAYQTLNEEQRQFFESFFTGKNVFVTGPAGVGKSYCLKVLFDFLESRGIFIGKCGLTGVAALNIGGTTVHSWAGLGLADEDLDSLKLKAFQNKKARERILGTGIVFVDEISMASADLLTKLDGVMQSIRRNKNPFGGVQLVMAGDFLQLPPVFRGQGEKLAFAFESKSWERGISSVHLKKLVRQDETSQFAALLQNIRFGREIDLSLLASRVDAKLECVMEPIRIFCKNIDIDAYNLERYSSIRAEEKTYICKDGGAPNYTNYFDKNCPVPPILKLKPGTQVMLLVNADLEGGLVNGSMGVVQGFSPNGPIVKFSNGVTTIVDTHKWEAKEQEAGLDGRMKYKVIATRTQVPLRHAWATSVHKQQGQTLDQAVVDLSNAFEYGQVYCALSRVKTLEGLSLADFHPSKIKAHPKCVKFYDELDRK